MPPPTGVSMGHALDTVLHVITTERDALSNLEMIYRTNDLAQKNISRAVDELVRTIKRGGKLIVCGVGKSGKIGRKLEATMNSVGIHSVFLHPTEALHGDLGMIRPIDTLLLISFSGRTAELLIMLPHIPPTVPVIAITSHTHPSSCPLLSYNSPDMTILLPAPLHIDEETSFGLSAPTSSTTVALALGDALALAAAQSLHDSPGLGPSEIFKGYHPGGSIGAATAAATSTNTAAVAVTASAISTPATSMTTSPSLCSLEDKLTLEDEVNINSDSDNEAILPPQIQQTIRDCEHFVSTECIPTVIPSSPQSTSSSSSAAAESQIRILDVLLTAIQNPHAKSWVRLSDTHIIPPEIVRRLTSPCISTSLQMQASQHSHYPIDTPLSFIKTKTTLTSIPSTQWLQLRASTTMDEARHMLQQQQQLRLPSPNHDQSNTNIKISHKNNPSTAARHTVISVMENTDDNPKNALGFIWADDLFRV